MNSHVSSVHYPVTIKVQFLAGNWGPTVDIGEQNQGVSTPTIGTVSGIKEELIPTMAAPSRVQESAEDSGVRTPTPSFQH